MSVSPLLSAQLIQDTSLDKYVEEDVIVSLNEPDSRWHAFLLRFMTPMKLKLRVLEILFLTVAFGCEPEARRSWNRFSTSGISLEELDSPDFSIFPALTKRLAEIAPEDRRLEKLKGHYKYTWTKNQLKLKELAECITVLQESGVGCIASKDAGLSLVLHSQRAARQIDRPALLVSSENYIRAQRLLSETNTNVCVMKLPHGKADALVWRDARSVDISGVQALSLSSSDLLLQHMLSAKFKGTNQRQWFADCLRLLPLFEDDIQVKQLRDRIDDSCSILDFMQAWCLFLRIADLTHCALPHSPVCKIFATMRVSSKELFYRSGNRLRSTCGFGLTGESTC